MRLFLILILSAPSVFAADIYADAYRFGDQNHTGAVGIQSEHWGSEIDAMTGGISLINRQYLEFTNIEIGARFELSAWSPADGSRTVGVDIHATPYLKVGSDLFGVIKLDKSNKAVVSVGFKLF